MNETWPIVLAAGEGSRLRSLVRLLHEQTVPKQFATLVGSRSLLQSTIERVSLVAPPERMMVVVSRSREELARRQLAEWDAIEIVSQPENRGTALGILLPLARLRRRNPDASVAIFPSDHYVLTRIESYDGRSADARKEAATVLESFGALERAISELPSEETSLRSPPANVAEEVDSFDARPRDQFAAGVLPGS